MNYVVIPNCKKLLKVIEAWIKGKLLILVCFIYEILLIGIVHLLGGGVYLMNFDILGVYCKSGF